MTDLPDAPHQPVDPLKDWTPRERQPSRVVSLLAGLVLGLAVMGGGWFAFPRTVERWEVVPQTLAQTIASAAPCLPVTVLARAASKEPRPQDAEGAVTAARQAGLKNITVDVERKPLDPLGQPKPTYYMVVAGLECPAAST